jgi:hypothetical protein
MVAHVDALAQLRPVSDDYAHLPVHQAFTWGECTSSIEPGEWYMVAFRSRVRPDADLDRLQLYDDWAHDEATRAPGFRHYFKGPLATDGSCMSFCLWDSRLEARAAAAEPGHRQAISIIGETYAHYVLEFHRVRRPSTSAALEFEPFDAAPGAPANRLLPGTEPGFSPAAS